MSEPPTRDGRPAAPRAHSVEVISKAEGHNVNNNNVNNKDKVKEHHVANGNSSQRNILAGPISEQVVDEDDVAGGHETFSSFEEFQRPGPDNLIDGGVGFNQGQGRVFANDGLRPGSVGAAALSPGTQPLFASNTSVPTFHRHYSFYNQLQGSRLSLLTDGVATQTSLDRVENLQEMRPFHLIGKSRPLAQWSRYLKSDEEISAIKNKKLRKYYESQNEYVSAYRDIDRLLDSGIPVSMLRMYGDDLQMDEEAETGSLQYHHGSYHHQLQRQGVPGNIDIESTPLLGSDSVQEQGKAVMFAIMVNFLINFILLLGKVVVALLTNSLSIIASLVDSLLDFLSTFIIWFSTRLVGRKDWRTKHLYPVGRSRLEPIGVLVFSVIMIVSFLKIGNEAISALLEGHDDKDAVVSIGVPSAIIMTFTVVVKLACWFWCKSVSSSAVQALAEDAKTDVIFNVFSMFFPILGFKTNTWWFDPLGALLLSVYVVISWGAIALEHIENLTGSAASPQERQIVLYMCMRFAENIKYITALSAYHTGDRITVEVDLILSSELNLKDSHDIGEALQYAIETLPFVERAFVHLDYRTGNFPGHLDR